LHREPLPRLPEANQGPINPPAVAIHKLFKGLQISFANLSHQDHVQVGGRCVIGVAGLGGGRMQFVFEVGEVKDL